MCTVGHHDRNQAYMHETKLGSSSNEANQQKVRSSLASTGRSSLKLDYSLHVAIDIQRCAPIYGEKNL
jgi:hypothetical protein